jgi:hypothetical protein
MTRFKKKLGSMFSRTLTNERKKQEFFFEFLNFEKSLLSISFYFHFLSLFPPELLSLTVSLTRLEKKNLWWCGAPKLEGLRGIFPTSLYGQSAPLWWQRLACMYFLDFWYVISRDQIRIWETILISALLKSRLLDKDKVIGQSQQNKWAYTLKYAPLKKNRMKKMKTR